MNAELMAQAIYDYFDESWAEGVIIVGSFAEANWGLSAVPRDIDVIVQMVTGFNRENETVYLPECGDIPINVEYLQDYEVYDLASNIEPKILCFMTNKTNIMNHISFRLTAGLKKSKVRKLVSRSTDRAFDKGRKKLVVPHDYDPVLGLKNLYHAFKFPIMAIWAFCEFPNDTMNMTLIRKDLHIMYLDDIRQKMEEIYYSTEGSLDERSRAVIEYAKPLHNKLMTEFRILFPKE